jgi:hypothetical protein
MADDGCGPARAESTFNLRDNKHGKVRLFIADRINVDDVVRHMTERELFRLAGGGDPGVEVNRAAIDFLVRERYIQR